MRYTAVLVALAALLGCTGALAGIGSVTESSGSATVLRGKNTVSVAVGTPIEQNDRIQTRNGTVKVVFQDKTVVTVAEHSSLVVDEFVYDPGSGSGKLGLRAAGGTVRYVSGAIAKDPKQVKINTPTAAIAVRGTDFVMSVDEAGRSMVILMPTCDWATSAVKGVVCGSGAIDVQSGVSTVSLTRPYQATLVETADVPPTPPITVNLFGAAINNNLQTAPPRTTGGANVVAAARAAASATGVGQRQAKKDGKDSDKEETKEGDSEEAQKTAAKSDSKPAAKKAESTEEAQTTTVTAKISTSAESQSKTTTATTEAVKEEENPYLKKLYSDRSETNQIGWAWESLSANNRNYAYIVQPLNTQIQIIVTQDMQTNSWSFTQRTLGQIVINQTFR